MAPTSDSAVSGRVVPLPLVESGAARAAPSAPTHHRVVPLSPCVVAASRKPLPVYSPIILYRSNAAAASASARRRDRKRSLYDQGQAVP